MKPCASLFGLAPCGVLPATRVTTGAVRSYRTFSPLPFDSRAALASRSLRAVYFLCHFPSGRPDRGLPGALPCGVRTFLPSTRLFELRSGQAPCQRLAVSEDRRAEPNGGHLARCEGLIVQARHG